MSQPIKRPPHPNPERQKSEFREFDHFVNCRDTLEVGDRYDIGKGEVWEVVEITKVNFFVSDTVGVSWKGRKVEG